MAKGRITLSATDRAKKWGNRLKSSIPEITKGIQSVTESPMAKAGAQADKWQQNTINARDRWKRNVEAVTLQEWQKRTIEKVNSRMSSGVDAGMAKRAKFEQYVDATYPGIMAEIQQMPQMNIQDSINRVAHWMTRMNENKYKDQ